MKDIMQKLAELEATAPKVTKKKMLKEDSVTPPMNVSNKPASLKDVFAALSENVVTGQKPLPVLDPQNKQAGMGFVTSDNPAVQNMLKNLDPKDVQIVQAPGQQATAAGQPAPAGATGQPQMGQMQMKEKDEGKPGKNFAKIAKSAGKRYGSKEAGERVAGAVRAKLAKQGKLEEENLDELSPNTLKSYANKADIDKVVTDRELKNRYHTGFDPELLKRSQNRTAGMKTAGDKVGGRAKVPANEGAKVDRMVKHPEKSKMTFEEWYKSTYPGDYNLAVLAKSPPAIECYEQAKAAWETANKRGMLDNKNKKKVKEGDIAPTNGIDTKGAGLGAGRSATTLEGKEPQVEVVDNAFNRANYKELIGKKYPKSKPPAYASVKEVTEGKKGVNPFPKKDDKASTKAPAKGKKPDFLDLDKDGNKKEPMKKAAADKKKKKVDESMNHRISAARLEGKSHGLRGHAHSGKRYEDLDELRAYHDGFKEGLDECYGQGVYETAPAATVGGMASHAMPAIEDDMEEGNAFTAALAKTPNAGKFSVGGKTFTDRTGYDAKVNEYAFESLDQQLNALLNESEEVTEGLSVSISKGQQNSPDSVTITAQDQEAEHLLAFVKNAGLGLFGDDNADTHSSAMSVQPSHGAPDEVGAGGIDIGVVDGQDGMMDLMQKLTGIQADGAEDYADEEGDDEQLYGNSEEADNIDCDDYDQPSDEASCNECGGMMEAGHSCGSKEVVDEVETEDQMEFEVSEDDAPESDEAETSADEDAEAKEDAALAGEKEDEVNESFFGLLGKLTKLAEAKEEAEDDEEVTESDDDAAEDEDTEDLNEWANQVGKGPGKGTDASFEQDIEFMTKVISGGLNKPKSTGQTTVPVITGQDDRMHANH